MAIKDKSTWYAARRFYYVSGLPTPKVDGVTHKLIRTRNGSNLPTWRSRVEKHVSATTELSGTFDDIGDVVIGKYAANSVPSGLQDGRGDFAGYNLSSPGTPNKSVTKATEKAVQYFYKSVHKAQAKMSGQVFLGELKEALHMLRHPAEGLLKAVKANYLDKLKQIKRTGGNRWKKSISSAWLEGSFGWIPFISDIEDAMSAYKALSDRNERYDRVRGVGFSDKDVTIVSADVTSIAPGQNVSFNRSHLLINDARCIISGEVKALAETTAVRATKLFGLSPSEFIPTAWELLPWSFLVDYFTNVGDILEAGCTDISNLTWVQKATIQSRERKIDYSLNRAETVKTFGGEKNVISLAQYSPSRASWRRRSVVRTALVDLSIPPLRFELPGSPLKYANMLALMVQTSKDLHPQSFQRRKINGRWYPVV